MWCMKVRSQKGIRISLNEQKAALGGSIAEMLGKPAAMFMPSGTMTNQVAVRLHCRPGDEFICESGCHIYNYEQGFSFIYNYS